MCSFGIYSFKGFKCLMLFSDQFNLICEKFGLFKFWLCVKQFDWVEKEWHGCLKIKICEICYFQHSFYLAHFFDNLEVFGRLFTWEMHRLYSIIAQSAPFQRKFLQKRLWLFSTHFLQLIIIFRKTIISRYTNDDIREILSSRLMTGLVLRITFRFIP